MKNYSIKLGLKEFWYSGIALRLVFVMALVGVLTWYIEGCGA